MEALICVLVEAIGALAAPLLHAFAALVGGLITLCSSALAELIRARLASRKVHRSDLQPTDQHTLEESPGALGSPSRRWIPRLLRWLVLTCAALTAMVFTSLFVINAWFIGDLARWLLSLQQIRSGIVIMAETIDGNLFSGRFTVTGITVKRSNHPVGTIDLSVRRLNATVSVWHVFTDPLAVDSVTVDGVHGRYERGAPEQEPLTNSMKLVDIPRSQDSRRTSPSSGHGGNSKRQFVINSLTVTELDVAYVDHTRRHPLLVPVTITKLTANPLRSQWAVFDILFRTNAAGTIAGSPFKITTSGDDLGRDTEWHVDSLPVTELAAQLGGPFALLTTGTADVNVVDHWRKSAKERVIVMDWSVVLNHVAAEVPDSTSKLMTLLAKPAVAFLNAKGERVPLSFRVELDEKRFDGTASAAASGLWDVVADSAAATLANRLGIESDMVKEAGGKVLEKAKDLFDRWRKKE